MSDVVDDPTRRLDVTRRAMSAGLALVQAAVDLGVDQPEMADDVNLVTASCSVLGRQLGDLRTQLVAASSAGHRITAITAHSGNELLLHWRSDGSVTPTLSGDQGELVAQRDADPFGRAISRDDGEGALRYLGDAVFTLEIVIKTPAEGASWVRTRQELVDRLSDQRWVSTLLRLMRDRRTAQPLPVLVQDAGDAMLATPGLLLVGPDAAFDHNLPPRDLQSTQAYKNRAGHKPREEILAPNELVPIAPIDRSMIDVSRVLCSSARAAAWYWIAESVDVTASNVIAHFEGVSLVDFALQPYGEGPPTAEIALSEWAMASGEPSRADAVQRAVTFAIRSADDVPRSASAVLRTARSLYEVAGRGLTSEALAARRAARDSAVAAARSAASTARDVATKSVERALALLIAVAVALFANSQKFIDNGTTYAIVIAVAALAGVALIIALTVDTRSGRAVLDAFETDVELYRETLGEDDIQATKNLAALSEARSDLTRSRWAVCGVYGSVIAVVIVGGLIAIPNRQANVDLIPAPSSTPSLVSQPLPSSP